MSRLLTRIGRCLLLALAVAGSLHPAAAAKPDPENAWWNAEWTVRKKIIVETAAAGVTAGGPALTTPVFIRLHEANFQFGAAREDASDVRFVAADQKTLLPFHIERFDGLLNEAFVWVKVSDLKAGGPTTFWLYYGNTGPNALRVDESKATYDAETLLVYHFAEKSAPPKDFTGNANNAEGPGTAVDGAHLGPGLRLTGQNAITIPKSDSLAWSEGQALTWSAWIKPAALTPNAVLFSRREDANALLIGLDNGVPYVEIINAAGSQRSGAGEPIAAGAWRQLAVVVSGAETKVFLDGESYASLAAGLPALNSAALVGRDGTPGAPDADAQPGFAGDLDELQISKTARAPSLLKLIAALQAGGEKTGKVLNVGPDEAAEHGGENELAKHLSLITDISKSLTIDGWVVIVLCALLALIGGWVSLVKLIYLGRIKKATRAFLQQWSDLAGQLHVLDNGDDDTINSMGGQVSAKQQKLLRQSPLYHLYQIGFSEIQDRLNAAGEDFAGLSGRSMQAIKATLDGGLVREVQKLNSSLVFLTIGIAGGPYLGLLGTVIGVMITFAVIAKSGQVEVNSIAPGIAGALLATVAGLAVAIPALFSYSYISTQIKDAVSEMQIFIDEFVAKIAEFYSGSQAEETAGAGKH